MSELNIVPSTAHSTLVFNYFSPPKAYFWRWAEEGKVVEWQNGNTICYREDLARVLHGLSEDGLPPLASVLLLLAACADTWPGLEEHNNEEVLRRLAYKIPEGSNDPQAGMMERWASITVQFLSVVRALPANLRLAEGKIHLFRAVLNAQAPQVTAEQARAVLEEWESGRVDELLRRFSGQQITRRQYFNDLNCLVEASRRFPTTEALALHLRTGLDKIPEPLPLPEPEPPAPAPEAPPTDLLAQLTQDARTAGLARLTQQLVAALRIPLHARGASDQPIGGVSDITNRGNFDRLLLSELAHDDDVLTARLVNNEALYLRREAPPRQDVRPRFILLDTTLRMWGVPRVFALAAALAWARNSRQARPPAPVAAVALGGSQFSPLDLESFDGVVAALGLLDVALHGGPALQAFARLAQAQAAADSLLITDAQLLHQPEFALALAEAKTALRFLLTVDRSGELQLYEYQNGHRTLVSTARYDLEELLFGAVPLRRTLQFPVDAESPAFLQQELAPLYFPVTGLRVSIQNTIYTAALGVVSITDRQRVLHWPNRETGARELLPVIESGTYTFGTDGATTAYILVSARRLLRVYALLTATGEAKMVDLLAELEHPAKAQRAEFKDGRFYVQQAEGTLVFDCQSWEIKDRRNSIFPAGTPSGFRPDFGHIKRHINNGYNVLHRVNFLGVSSQGELVIEGHTLCLVSNAKTLSQELHLLSKNLSNTSEEIVQHVVKIEAKSVALTANQQVPLRRFAWADGSSGLLDSRGLLHLRSADATIPEITLVLILGQPTAAWASDGTVCGPAYFTGPNPVHRLPASEFNRQYLQRFIAHFG